MTWVRNGQVLERRPWHDLRQIPEFLFACIEGIFFFFITIISPDANTSWVASAKKKNDDLPPGAPSRSPLAVPGDQSCTMI